MTTTLTYNPVRNIVSLNQSKHMIKKILKIIGISCLMATETRTQDFYVNSLVFHRKVEALAGFSPGWL